MTALRVDGQAQSDVGKIRDHNEDCYCALPNAGIWAVADGMGGHDRGDWAASAVVEAIAAVEPSEDFEQGVAAVADAIHCANDRIFAEAESTGAQMGATVVAAVMRERRFGMLWAGDSRAYVLRNNVLHRLTRDHSQVQELVDEGLLPVEAAEGHPMSNVLARAVGVRPELELDAVTDEMKPGDIFLLCSDGLHSIVEDAEIARLLDPAASQADPAVLIAASLERGAPDNVTVVTIEVSEPTHLRFASAGGKNPA